MVYIDVGCKKIWVGLEDAYNRMQDRLQNDAECFSLFLSPERLFPRLALNLYSQNCGFSSCDLGDRFAEELYPSRLAIVPQIKFF